MDGLEKELWDTFEMKPDSFKDTINEWISVPKDTYIVPFSDEVDELIELSDDMKFNLEHMVGYLGDYLEIYDSDGIFMYEDSLAGYYNEICQQYEKFLKFKPLIEKILKLKQKP